MPAHKHAELMKQYAEDAAETDRPWELWQMKLPGCDCWERFSGHPHWRRDYKYRRNPPTITVDVPKPIHVSESGLSPFRTDVLHATLARAENFRKALLEAME